MRLWMKALHVISFAALSLTLLSACTRAPSTSKTTVQMDLSNLVSMKGLASANGSGLATFIQVIVINVTGPGIAAPIYSQWQNSQDGSATVPSGTTVSVPTGDNRLVQALILVADQSGSGQFFYGDSTLSLQGDSSVTIPLAPVGPVNNVSNNNIKGRYLNALGTGPTGKIAVFYPVTGKPSMLVDNNGEIFAGWFRIFAINGASLSYYSDDGTNIFGQPMDLSTTSLMSTPLATKVFVPPSYRQQNGTYSLSAASESAYGFFGPGATAGTYATCYNNSSQVQVSNVYTSYVNSTPSSPLIWGPNDGSLTVATDTTAAFVESGGVGVTGVSAGSVCQPSSIPNPVAFRNYLSVNEQEIASGDEVLGFRGPFIGTYSNGNYNYLNVTTSGNIATVSWTYLPGVERGLDGVELFARLESDGSGSNQDYKTNNGVDCADLVTNFNFRSLKSVPVNADPTILTASASIDLTAAPTLLANITNGTNYTLIACPYRATASGLQYFTSAAVMSPGGNQTQAGQANQWSMTFPANGILNGATAPTVYENTCVPIQIQALDSGGNVVLLPASTLFTLSALSGSNTLSGDSFHLQEDCSDTLNTSFSVPGNGKSVTVYYQNTQSVTSGSGNITVSSSNFGSQQMTGGSLPFNYKPAGADAANVVIAGFPTSIVAYQCYPVWFMTALTSTEVTPAQYSSSAQSIYPMKSGTGGSSVSYYSDPACTMTFNGSFNLGGWPGGTAYPLYFSYQSTSPASFYLTSTESPLVGTPSATIASSNITQPGTAVSLNMNLNNMMAVGVCNTITVRFEDSQGNVVPENSTATVTATMGVQGSFYESDCSTSLSETTQTLSWSGGTPTYANFYFIPSAAGSGNLQMTTNVTGVAPATNSVSVSAAP